MGIDKAKFSRLKGHGVDRDKIPDPHVLPPHPGDERSTQGTSEKTDQTSRLLGKSPISSRDKAEPQHHLNNISLGMKVVQRDDPEADWEISRIHGNMVLLRDRNRNASISKKIDRLIGELNTPGSPWRFKE